MKKTIRILLAIALVAVFALALAACNPCANGHDWEEVEVTTEATCTNPGERLLKCKNCDATTTDVIHPLEHQLTHHDPVLAKCEETGIEAYWTCSSCNQMFSDEGITVIETPQTLPARGHAYRDDSDGKVWVEWDTTEFSKVTYHLICADCDKQVSLEFTDGITKNTIPATCGEDAHGTYSIAPTVAQINALLAEYDGKLATGIGDNLFKSEYLWANEGTATGAHTFDKYTPNDDGATHTVECSVCGEIQSNNEAHQFDETTHKCEKCGALDPTFCDHSSRTKVDAQAPTCNADGTIEYWTCDNCGKKFADETSSEEITNIVDSNRPAHDYTEYTDNQNGTHTVFCSVCGNADPDHTDEAHAYTEADGEQCKCGAEKPEDVITYRHNDGEVKHTVITNDVDGDSEDCDFTGSDANTCAKCEYVYVADVTFGQTDYTIVASGSTGSWTSTAISASVSNSANESGVNYTFNHDSISLANGTVTATRLGTFTITAESVGINKEGSKVQVTATVLVYTNSMYLTGVVSGTTDWTTSTSWSLTKAADNKSYSIKDLLLYTNDGFKVVYGGMDSNWDGAITNNGDNFTVSESAYYTVTVDISGTDPVVSTEKTDDYTPPADWSFTKTISIDVIGYNNSDNWNGNVYSETISVDANNPSASITYDFSASVFSSATSQVEIGFNDGSTWYGKGTKNINYDNSSSSVFDRGWVDGKWYNWHDSSTNCNDALKFVGSVSGKTFTFTFTFDSTGTITECVISQ